MLGIDDTFCTCGIHGTGEDVETPESEADKVLHL